VRDFFEVKKAWGYFTHRRRRRPGRTCHGDVVPVLDQREDGSKPLSEAVQTLPSHRRRQVNVIWSIEGKGARNSEVLEYSVEPDSFINVAMSPQVYDIDYYARNVQKAPRRH